MSETLTTKDGKNRVTGHVVRELMAGYCEPVAGDTSMGDRWFSADDWTLEHIDKPARITVRLQLDDTEYTLTTES